jgi:hypothetical protein
MLSTTWDYLFAPADGKRPPAPLPVESPLTAWQAPVESGLRATWLGHSTVLLEIDRHRVLTDPVWSERIAPVSFAGPRRFHPAAVALADLPQLDAVLVSHDHYDHLDAPTLRSASEPGSRRSGSTRRGSSISTGGRKRSCRGVSSRSRRRRRGTSPAGARGAATGRSGRPG